MRYRFINIIVAIILVCFLPGCVPTSTLQTPESKYAALYNPSEFSLNAEFRVYHISDKMSSLFIRLFPRQFLFNQANDQGEYRAVVNISYLIYELGEKGEILAMSDTTEFTLKLDRQDESSSAYFTTRVLGLQEGKRYLLRLETRDVQRGTLGLDHLFVDKTDALSAQNFSVVSARTGYPRFLDYMVPGELFRIKYRLLGQDTIFLDFFEKKQGLPRPSVTLNSPSYFPVVPDTTIALAYSDTTIYTLPGEGMYHFRFDSASNEGVTLYNFGHAFPQVKTPEAMLEPAFYIATLTEYRNLQNAEDIKRAIDDFWLSRASNMERSRELIRVYYNRVLYSNIYFTTGREGWKTDRGMVFILFGPPDRIRDTGMEERWYYISRRQGKVIDFIFERKPGVYANQDMTWKKDLQSMQYWNAAVNSWRSGKIYSLSR